MKNLILISRTLKFVALISLFVASASLKAQSGPLGSGHASARFYPNPFDDAINVQLQPAPTAVMKFQLRTMAGTVVLEQVLQSAEAHVNTSSIPPGQYVAYVLNAKGAAIYREQMRKVEH